MGLRGAWFAEAASPQRTLTLPSGRPLTLEVADTPETRQRGLMFRPALAKNQGMLFIFEKPGHYRFWMKNCKFPLDILWLNTDHEIIYVSENTPPCTQDPCPQYGPDVNTRYAIEMQAGTIKRERLKVGTKFPF